MLVPLYGFVEGDTMGLLVLAHHDMPMQQVGRLLAESARVRGADADAAWNVVVAGRTVDPEATVSDLGLEPLQRIDLRSRKA